MFLSNILQLKDFGTSMSPSSYFSFKIYIIVLLTAKCEISYCTFSIDIFYIDTFSRQYRISYWSVICVLLLSCNNWCLLTLKSCLSSYILCCCIFSVDLVPPPDSWWSCTTSSLLLLRCEERDTWWVLQVQASLLLPKFG